MNEKLDLSMETVFYSLSRHMLVCDILRMRYTSRERACLLDKANHTLTTLVPSEYFVWLSMNPVYKLTPPDCLAMCVKTDGAYFVYFVDVKTLEPTFINGNYIPKYIQDEIDRTIAFMKKVKNERL